MPTFRIAGRSVDLDHQQIERKLESVLPEPVKEHYVVVLARRFPPKQVVSEVAGIDRADFTTHQARRILKRLGFTAARASRREPGDDGIGLAPGPHGGRQAAALAPFAGQWVALAGPTEVLVAAGSPQDVLSWLARYERKATGGIFRVPESVTEAEGLAPH